MQNTRDIRCRVELYDTTTITPSQLKQGDTTRLTIDVFKGGEPYGLDGLGLLLNVKRGDELVYIQTGSYTIDGNAVTWVLENPIVAEPGRIELEAVLTAESGEVVSSFVFRLNVEPRLLRGDEDIAPDDQNEIIDAARDAAMSVAQAREAAQSAAQSETNAGNSATAAADSERSATDSAFNANTAAQGAAASEAAAKQSQESAAQSAASAQTDAQSAQTAQKAAETAKADAEASATKAKTDADRAENAASAAKDDAQSAQLAANSANTSATNARSSEQSAAKSASAAAQSEANAAASEKSAAESAQRAQDTVDNAGFAAMEIGEDGWLYLIRTDNIVDLIDFSINNNGVLEAIVS